MATYQESLDAGTTGHFGLSLIAQPLASDVFGHRGVGIILATNFVLRVLDEIGLPVDRGTPYTITYYNPATGQQVALPLFHNPSAPYQGTFPENQPILFTLDSGSRYAPNQTAQIVIPTNGYGVMEVTLYYPTGTVYSRLTRTRFL